MTLLSFSPYKMFNNCCFLEIKVLNMHKEEKLLQLGMKLFFLKEN